MELSEKINNVKNSVKNKIESLNKKKEWHKKQSEDYLNNSWASMLQHEKSISEIEGNIKHLDSILKEIE